MIDVALIGAGAMGHLHAATVARHPGTRLRRVFDVDVDRAEALAVRTGATIGRPAPDDWVIVATPAQTHAAVLEPLVEQVVLVEKPLAPTAEVARGVVRRRLFVGHSERFSLRLHECSRDMRTIEAFRGARASPRGRDVDVIADLLVHDVDRVVQLIEGRPVVRSVSRARVGAHGLDAVTVMLEWNGGSATLSVDRATDDPRRTFLVDGKQPSAWSGSDALTRQLDAWIRARDGEEPHWGVSTSAQALVVMELCDRVRELAG